MCERARGESRTFGNVHWCGGRGDVWPAPRGPQDAAQHLVPARQQKVPHRCVWPSNAEKWVVHCRYSHLGKRSVISYFGWSVKTTITRRSHPRYPFPPVLRKSAEGADWALLSAGSDTTGVPARHQAIAGGGDRAPRRPLWGVCGRPPAAVHCG